MTPVVLVHGLWMPGSELALLRRRLSRAGFAPAQYRYRSLTYDLDRSAAGLAALLEKVPGETVHLVGHSLGGLVILKSLERHGALRIGRIVCLGSPLCGSVAAENLLRWPGGARLLGRAMIQALAESSERYWHGPCELGIVAGRVPVGLGRLFGPMGKPNDGTVAVVETALPGATDHIVLPVTHFSMLWSGAVADQVTAFLRDGSFARR